MKTDRESILTTAYLHEAFTYIDGELYWKQRPLYHFKNVKGMHIFNSRQAHTKAGSLNHGYVRVRLTCGVTFAHRIIFLMLNGYLPKEIDHIDGNPSNNKIANLREATHAQNARNMKTNSRNTSGAKGVYFHKLTKKWQVIIREAGRYKQIGLFANFDDAKAARKQAEQEFYKEFANER